MRDLILTNLPNLSRVWAVLSKNSQQLPANMPEKIDPTTWYSASKAAEFLGITEGSVKKNLRERKLAGEQKGPKKRWHVTGRAIIELRKKWNMD